VRNTETCTEAACVLGSVYVPHGDMTGHTDSADALLIAGDGLRVLAISREPLGVPGEVVYPVYGLPVPAREDTASTAAVLLGAAGAARDSAAGLHVRPIDPPDEELRRRLIGALGAAAFEGAHREGKGLTAAQALQAASFPN
jgi:hypothetical protein